MHVTMLDSEFVSCRYLLQQRSSEPESLPLCRTFASLLDHMGLEPSPELRDMKFKVSSGTQSPALVRSYLPTSLPCNNGCIPSHARGSHCMHTPTYLRTYMHISSHNACLLQLLCMWGSTDGLLSPLAHCSCPSPSPRSVSLVHSMSPGPVRPSNSWEQPSWPVLRLMRLRATCSLGLSRASGPVWPVRGRARQERMHQRALLHRAGGRLHRVRPRARWQRVKAKPSQRRRLCL